MVSSLFSYTKSATQFPVGYTAGRQFSTPMRTDFGPVCWKRSPLSIWIFTKIYLTFLEKCDRMTIQIRMLKSRGEGVACGIFTLSPDYEFRGLAGQLID